MTEITTHLRQDITIDNHTNLIGIITGNIKVDNASNFIVHGIVNGDITVKSNSKALIHGRINGNIINAGLCEIFGVVNGKLIDKGGKFDISPKAIINENI